MQKWEKIRKLKRWTVIKIDFSKSQYAAAVVIEEQTFRGTRFTN